MVLTINDIKNFPVFQECLQNSKVSNPHEGGLFHEYNAASECVLRLGEDLEELSNMFAGLAADYSVECEEDCDLENEHDNEAEYYY